MKISLENEIRLKNMLRQKDKEKESNLLVKEIENKESNMLNQITKEYLNIIGRCNDLNTIKNKIPYILEQNEILVTKFREISIEIEDIEREIRDHEVLDEKIRDLLNELSLLEKYFKLVNSSFKSSDELYFYSLTRNLEQTKNLVSHFRDYKTYDEINEIYVQYFKKTEIETFKFFTEYKNQQIKESSFLGKRILEIVNSTLTERPKIIFNDLLSLRNRFIKKNLLDILYMKKKLDSTEDFIDKFNLERRAFISNYDKNTNIMYCFTAEILNSYFLVRLNKNFLDYYDFLLENINEYFINNDINQMFEVKEVLISIKILMRLLNIEDDNLNETIGRISLEYFNRSDIKNNEDRNEYRNEIDRFIKKAVSFIDRLNNNEINEIFVNKVDLYLKDLIATSSSKNILDDEIFVKKTIKKVKNVFPNINFRSSRILQDQIEAIKFEIVKSKMSEIDRIFKESRNLNVDLQNYVSSHSEIRKELYGILKIKFIEMINDFKDAKLEEKRIVAGRVTCFYKYLLENDKSLAEDFKNVNEEANKF